MTNNMLKSIREKLTDNQIKSLDCLSKGFNASYISVNTARTKVNAYLDALVDANVLTRDEAVFIVNIYCGIKLAALYGISKDKEEVEDEL